MWLTDVCAYFTAIDIYFDVPWDFTYVLILSVSKEGSIKEFLKIYIVLSQRFLFVVSKQPSLWNCILHLDFKAYFLHIT
jgi:hypothetical protein